MIKLIVGLGNPGQKYERTRHNAGFWFLEDLQDQGWTRESRFGGEVASFVHDGHKILLLKPMTFMNKSGMSVGNLVRYYKIHVNEVLVAHDELDLDVGCLRLKQGGGHAGHNGLRDIIANLGSKEFARIRIGIGRPKNGQVVSDYVLSDMPNQEKEIVYSAFENIRSHLDNILKGEFSLVMNSLHR